MSAQVSFNMKIAASDKAELLRLAEELGIPAVTIVKSMIRKFVSVGGFPYDVRVDSAPVVNWNSPRILDARVENGKLIMPKEWRDDDDPEEDNDY